MASAITHNPFIAVIRKGFALLPTLAVLAVLQACVPAPYRPQPWPLEKAVRMMADDLLNQLTARRGVLVAISNATMVTDAVIDFDTGEVTRTSQRIQGFVIAETRARYPGFNIYPMTSENIGTATYVVSGVMRLEPYSGNADKLTRLSMSVVDAKTGQVVAHSEAWIADANLEVEPTPMYKDSPMYIKDRRVKALIATALATAGSMADREYFDTLATTALLGEAENAYNQGNYSLALGLFGKAAERSDGKIMKTYTGLYESFLKLGRRDSAEEAFSSLVDLGIDNRNLSMKFLFESNRTEFIRDREQRAEYAIWLRQLAQHIIVAGVCTQIIGHASKAGTQQHNDELSLARAETIRKQLSEQFRERRARGGKSQELLRKTRPIGRGFDECKKCTGNEIVDAYDRRVEFNLVDCAGL